MPLSDVPGVNEDAQSIIDNFHKAFGLHPGFRPAHAKGQLLTGTFTPTAEAKKLSKAPHFQHDSTPVLLRFSNSSGLPAIPDTDPNGMPRGFALRFMYAGPHKHTDIVGHSTPHFPVPTGHDFLEFLQSLLAGQVEAYVGSHPATARFVTTPKPYPVSFATESYYMLNAFKFISPEGKEQYVRYSVKPVAGNHHLSDAEAKEKGDTYIFDELKERISNGPIKFEMYAQLAEEGDPTNDITKEWPEERKQVLLGTVEADKLVEENEKEQKHVIFDPMPRVEGIEASDDPIIDFRAALYLISGRERRKA